MIAPDAEKLRDELLSSVPATISYNAAKRQEVLDEDRLIGALDLRLRPAAVRVTDVDEVFAR